MHCTVNSQHIENQKQDFQKPSLDLIVCELSILSIPGSSNLLPDINCETRAAKTQFFLLNLYLLIKLIECIQALDAPESLLICSKKLLTNSITDCRNKAKSPRSVNKGSDLLSGV